MGDFGPKNDFITFTKSRDHFEFLHSEKGQEVHGNNVNGFSEKNSHLGQMGHFGPGNGVSS